MQSLVDFAHSEIRLRRVKSLCGEIFTFGKCEIFASQMLMKILRLAKSTLTLHSALIIALHLSYPKQKKSVCTLFFVLINMSVHPSTIAHFHFGTQWLFLFLRRDWRQYRTQSQRSLSHYLKVLQSSSWNNRIFCPQARRY